RIIITFFTASTVPSCELIKIIYTPDGTFDPEKLKVFQVTVPPNDLVSYTKLPAMSVILTVASAIKPLILTSPVKPGRTGLGYTFILSKSSKGVVAKFLKETIPFRVTKNTSPVAPSIVTCVTSLLGRGEFCVVKLYNVSYLSDIKKTPASAIDTHLLLDPSTVIFITSCSKNNSWYAPSSSITILVGTNCEFVKN